MFWLVIIVEYLIDQSYHPSVFRMDGQIGWDMNWTLDQLQTFVTAASEGSFSAAARRLGKAQSRVSTAINNLELDLGFALFDRSGRMPVLTPAGKEMLQEARPVLAQCQRLHARAMSASNERELSLTVAIDEAVPIVFFEKFFQKVSEHHPLLKLTIINGSEDDIAQWVDNHEADIGIVFHRKNLQQSLDYLQIGEFFHSLVVATGHPLAKLTAPTAQELSQYRQLMICDQLGLTQSPVMSANH